MAVPVLIRRSLRTPPANRAAVPERKNSLKNVYFGEQHLHSYWSADAFATGSRQKPEDAYRW
ncbi:MAG: DUF3604 domain-containing protein, partial [Desulfosarcina sp.]|nr:DUF3604 domain-containing protein [Desulfobacterales bacterium]